jgi:hypothetical protein
MTSEKSLVGNEQVSGDWKKAEIDYLYKQNAIIN